MWSLVDLEEMLEVLPHDLLADQVADMYHLLNLLNSLFEMPVLYQCDAFPRF